MARLTDIEDQVIALLTPLTAADATPNGPAVATVQPYVDSDDVDVDGNDELQKVLGSRGAALLVTIAGSELDSVLALKVTETITVAITIYVRNAAAQSSVTRGDARRLGVYDLIDLVRALVENQGVTACPGARFLFNGHSRQDYSVNAITWRLEYQAKITTAIDPQATDEEYARVLTRINDLRAPDPDLSFETPLETTP